MTDPVSPAEVVAISVSYRGMQERTRKILASWVKIGGGLLMGNEANPVDLARNLALTRAVKDYPVDSARTIGLLIDDDMAPTIDQMIATADHCKQTGRPCSAAYINDQGQILARRKVATRIASDALSPVAVNYWQTGLGLFAVPLQLLRDLAAISPVVQHWGQPMTCFCWTGPSCEDPPEWWNDDDCLCWRLAAEVGAPPQLVPVIVEHLRIRGIAPTTEEVETLLKGDGT